MKNLTILVAVVAIVASLLSAVVFGICVKMDASDAFGRTRGGAGCTDSMDIVSTGDITSSKTCLPGQRMTTEKLDGLVIRYLVRCVCVAGAPDGGAG